MAKPPNNRSCVDVAPKSVAAIKSKSEYPRLKRTLVEMKDLKFVLN